MNKTGNLAADLHLLRDLNAEMVVTQRATKKIQNHIKRLQEQHQAVKWSFYTTGQSQNIAALMLSCIKAFSTVAPSEGLVSPPSKSKCDYPIDMQGLHWVVSQQFSAPTQIT